MHNRNSENRKFGDILNSKMEKEIEDTYASRQ